MAYKLDMACGSFLCDLQASALIADQKAIKDVETVAYP